MEVKIIDDYWIRYLFNIGPREPKYILSRFQCRFKKICGICIECCYKKRVLTGFGSCHTPEKCPNLEICAELEGKSEQELQLVESNLNETIMKRGTFNLSNPDLRIPRFVPSIELGSEKKELFQVECIKNANLGMFRINLSKLFTYKSGLLLKPRFQGDLHDIFGFQGSILLTLDGPDLLCLKLIQNLSYAMESFQIMGLDLITTFDAGFYFTYPPVLIKYTLTECYNASFALKALCIPILPFYYPILPYYNKYQFPYLENSEATIFTIPFYEFNQYKRDLEISTIRNSLVHELKQFKKKSNAKIMLLGQSPLRKKEFFADCFSSATYRHFEKKLPESQKFLGQWMNGQCSQYFNSPNQQRKMSKFMEKDTNVLKKYSSTPSSKMDKIPNYIEKKR